MRPSTESLPPHMESRRLLPVHGRIMAGDSLIRRLDSRTKLIAYACLSVALFASHHFAAIGVATVFVLIVARTAKTPIKRLARGLIPFLWIFTVTGLTHLLSSGGESIPPFPMGPLDVTWEGLFAGLAITAKLAIMLAGSILLVETTPAPELAAGIERLLSPLSVFRINVARWAAILSLSLAFIPLLQTEAERLLDATKSRGMAPYTRNVIKRGWEASPLLPLLFTRLFERAACISDTFSARGYHDCGTARLETGSRFRMGDLLAGGATLAVCLLVVVL